MRETQTQHLVNIKISEDKAADLSQDTHNLKLDDSPSDSSALSETPSSQQSKSFLISDTAESPANRSGSRARSVSISSRSEADDLVSDAAFNKNLFFSPSSGRPVSIAEDAMSIVSKHNEKDGHESDPELSLNSLDDISFSLDEVEESKSKAVTIDIQALSMEAFGTPESRLVGKSHLREAITFSVPGLAGIDGSSTPNLGTMPNLTSAPMAKSVAVLAPPSKQTEPKKKQSTIKLGPFYVSLDHKFSVIDALSPELLQVLDIQKTDSIAKLPKDTSNLYPANDTILMETATDGKTVFRACSLPALIDLLVSEKTEADLEFVTDFLMTLNYFADPIDVARLIALRYLEAKEKIVRSAVKNKDAPPVSGKEKVDWDAMVQMRLLNVLRKWIDNHWVDFETNTQLCRIVYMFMKFEVVNDTKKQIFAKSIMQKMEQKAPWLLGDENSSENEVKKTTESSKVSQANSLAKTKFSIIEAKAEILAQEITLVEFESFKKIQLNEFFQQSWSIKDKELRQKIAPNLITFIDGFNRMAYGVASEIVSQPKLKDRVEVLKKFIFVASHCAKIRNFNTCFEIVAGLNLGAVSRLKKTWKSLPKKYEEVWQRLSQLVTNEGNYKSYRNVMQNVIGFPPADPIVPYLGMFLSDMTFIEDGNPTYVDDEQNPGTQLVNFAKFRMLAHAFKVITTYQKKEFTFKSVPEYRTFLTANWTVLSEAELYTRAKQCEPSQQQRKASNNMGSIREILPSIGTISRRQSGMIAPSFSEAKLGTRERSSSTSSKAGLNAPDEEQKAAWRKMFKS